MANQTFEEFMESVGDIRSEEQVNKLRTMLTPHLLRRLKKDVLKMLPAKAEILVPCPMSRLQREYYEAILSRNYQFLRAGPKSEKLQLQSVTVHLIKCCNHPYLFPDAEPPHDNNMSEDETMQRLVAASGKLMLLDKLLAKLKAGGNRVLVFSQSTRLLDILEDYLFWRQYTYERIDGSTGSQERRSALERFNRPDGAFCFLLSTRACRLGLNLTAADTVVLYDSDWNPHNDLQAFSRVHRIGQTRKVLVFRLYCEHSIEEAILQCAQSKLVLEQIVVKSIGTKIDKSELTELLRKSTIKLFAASESESLGRLLDEKRLEQLVDRAQVGIEDSDAAGSHIDELGSFNVVNVWSSTTTAPTSSSSSTSAGGSGETLALTSGSDHSEQQQQQQQQSNDDGAQTRRTDDASTTASVSGNSTIDDASTTVGSTLDTSMKASMKQAELEQLDNEQFWDLILKQRHQAAATSSDDGAGDEGGRRLRTRTRINYAENQRDIGGGDHKSSDSDTDQETDAKDDADYQEEDGAEVGEEEDDDDVVAAEAGAQALENGDKELGQELLALTTNSPVVRRARRRNRHRNKGGIPEIMADDTAMSIDAPAPLGNNDATLYSWQHHGTAQQSSATTTTTSSSMASSPQAIEPKKQLEYYYNYFLDAFQRNNTSTSSNIPLSATAANEQPQHQLQQHHQEQQQMNVDSPTTTGSTGSHLQRQLQSQRAVSPTKLTATQGESAPSQHTTPSPSPIEPMQLNSQHPISTTPNTMLFSIATTRDLIRKAIPDIATCVRSVVLSYLLP